MGWQWQWQWGGRRAGVFRNGWARMGGGSGASAFLTQNCLVRFLVFYPA